VFSMADMLDRPLIVNATAIGRRVDGIVVYGVNMVKALWGARVGRPLTVVLNEDARAFFPESEIPAGASIQWVSARISPTRGTAGNLHRWLFANYLARQRRDALIFGLSQLEAPIVGGRSIVTVHDMIPWLFRSAHPRQSHFYRHYLGRALKHAHAVVTPSHATKDDVCRCYGIEGSRVHVIRHGSPVPVSKRAKSDKQHDRYILWIGRADPTKNLPALLAAFRMIERVIDVRLIIAGEGSPVDLAAIGEDYGSLGRVTVLGPVSESEKIALLDRASVLVSPSLYEGFGFAPLEAMARGCPVVCARVGALPEVCGDAALYVDPQQPRLIADALLQLLRRPDLARNLAERGRARTSVLTWEASVRAHLAVFDYVARHETKGRAARANERDGAMEADVLP
jgi:glycosyltransferase involved in cell wall biosynthesis